MFSRTLSISQNQSLALFSSFSTDYHIDILLAKHLEYVFSVLQMKLKITIKDRTQIDLTMCQY